jgi:hypothetical protein
MSEAPETEQTGDVVQDVDGIVERLLEIAGVTDARCSAGTGC